MFFLAYYTNSVSPNTHTFTHTYPPPKKKNKSYVEDGLALDRFKAICSNFDSTYLFHFYSQKMCPFANEELPPLFKRSSPKSPSFRTFQFD